MTSSCVARTRSTCVHRSTFDYVAAVPGRGDGPGSGRSYTSGLWQQSLMSTTIFKILPSYDCSPEVQHNFIIRRRQRTAERPTTDIHRFLVLHHLTHLHRVDRTHRMQWLAFRCSALQPAEEFVRCKCRREREHWCATLPPRDVLCAVRSRYASKPW